MATAGGGDVELAVAVGEGRKRGEGLSVAEPKGKKSNSCSSCRLRRVKCFKEPGRDECTACLSKGIMCIPGAPKRRKSRPGDPVMPQEPTYAMELSSTSTSAQLADGEFRGALVSSIIDLFFQMPDRLTLVKPTNLVPAFERASRRIELLNPEQNALIHHLTPDAQDLSACGRNRTSVCDYFLRKAIKQIDESALLRHASLTSLSCLVIMQGLLAAEPELKMTADAYAAACAAHTRMLLEDPDTSEKTLEAITGELGLAILSRDSLCLDDTRGPLLSDNDVDLLAVETIEPLPELLASGLRGQKPSSAFIRLFRATLFHLSMASRKASPMFLRHRSGKSRVMDEEVLREYFSDLEVADRAMPLIESKVVAWVGPPGSSGLHYGAELSVRVWSLVRVIRAHHASRLWRPYQVITSRTAGAAKNSRAISAEVARAALKGAREMCHQVQFLLQSGAPMHMISTASDVLLQSKMWARPLLYTPAFEEGGPDPTYTFDDKLLELAYVARGLRFASFSYDVVDSIRWIERSIEKVRSARAKYDGVRGISRPVPTAAQQPGGPSWLHNTSATTPVSPSNSSPSDYVSFEPFFTSPSATPSPLGGKPAAVWEVSEEEASLLQHFATTAIVSEDDGRAPYVYMEPEDSDD